MPRIKNRHTAIRERLDGAEKRGDIRYWWARGGDGKSWFIGSKLIATHYRKFSTHDVEIFLDGIESTYTKNECLD